MFRFLNTCLFFTMIMWQAASTAAEKQSVLNSVARCPSDASLTLLSAVPTMKDLAECAVACASSDRCAGIYFSKDGSNSCYHAEATQLAALWDRAGSSAADGCTTYTYATETEGFSPPDASLVTVFGEKATTEDVSTKEPNVNVKTTAENASTNKPTPSKAPSPVPGLSAELASKLVILLDFRQGFTNLINSSKYWATPTGSITRDSQGAHFPGTISDYIEVDTDGNTLASKYLDFANNFTFFVRLTRQAWAHQNYHYFHNCAGTVQYEFCDHMKKLLIGHAYSGQSSLSDATETVYSMDTYPILETNEPVELSAAAAFTGIHLSKLYVNGTAISAGGDENHADNGAPLCLRLGYATKDRHALKGRFVCYAISKAALTQSEVAQLHQYCD